MLRGFRWQLVALISASILFIAGLSARLSTPDPTVPTTTPEIQAATAETEAPAAPTPNPGVVIAPETPAEGIETFREGLVGQIKHLNPLLAAQNSGEEDITSLIFEGLTQINAYGEPVPALAESWVISSNGLEYVMRLRQDVLWQDGLPFTASDVSFTMGILRAPDFPGPAELGAFWRTVETERLGDHLVRFRLTQPLGSFLDKLRIGILPEHALLGVPASTMASHPFNLSPIGTGPYQLEALRSSDGSRIDQIDLRTAPVYRQRPEGQSGYAFERMRFQIYDKFDDALAALGNNELDGLAAPSRSERSDLLRMTGRANLRAYTSLEPVLGVLVYNWQRDSVRFFREQRVRLALETGINRPSALDRWLLNTAVQADSPLLPNSWAYTPDLTWRPYDATAATFLLETANLRIPTLEAEATQEVASNGASARLSFSVLTRDDPALIGLMNEFAAQWAQLNVNVEVIAADTDSYLLRLDTGEFDAALIEMSLAGSADPDVYAFWHQGQYPDGENFGGVDDRRISEVLERARQEPNNLNRMIYYQRFQREFVDRAVALPIYYPLFTYIASSRVDGVQLGFLSRRADRFQTLKDWRPVTN